MEDSRYQPQIGALLRMAWESLQAEVYANLRAAGFDDLREAHRPFLRNLPIDGMRPTDLAIRLGLSKQATNDLLRDLERTGYIRLDRDPSDGRARIIRFTDRGWRLFDAGFRFSREVGERWAKAIGHQQYDQFAATLRAIVDLNRS